MNPDRFLIKYDENTQFNHFERNHYTKIGIIIEWQLNHLSESGKWIDGTKCMGLNPCSFI